MTNTLIAPVKSAERRTSVWSVFKAPRWKERREKFNIVYAVWKLGIAGCQGYLTGWAPIRLRRRSCTLFRVSPPPAPEGQSDPGVAQRWLTSRLRYGLRETWEILHERKDWMKNIFRRQPCGIILLPSKPCLKTEMHQTFPSYADDYKFRAILQKTMPFELNILWQTIVFHSKGTFISAQLTFNAFPEVIAVSSYRGEFAQVVVRAPDVHVFILRAAHDERIIMTRRAGNKSRLQKWALIHISEDTSTIQMVFHFQAHCIYKWACLHDSTHARYKSN